jgi:hypothetical protein
MSQELNLTLLWFWVLILREFCICLCLKWNKRSLFDCIRLWPALGQTIYLTRHCIISQKNIKITVHRTAILSVVRRWCGTCHLKLKEEHRLKMLEMREPRKIFLPGGKEITEGWLKLCRTNDELYYLCS